MKCKKMRDVIASAALLLALAVPSAATGQSIDNFFYLNDSEYRDNDNTGGTGSWLNFGENPAGEATWEGFEEGNPLPTGGGLLVLALSGACYAGAKRLKSRKLKD